MNLCDLVRRAVDVQRVEKELRDLKAAYANAIEALNTEKRRNANLPGTLPAALLRVEAADAREEALQSALATERERVADLAFQLECMSCDNADLERVNAALMASIEWNGWRKEST